MLFCLVHHDQQGKRPARVIRVREEFSVPLPHDIWSVVYNLTRDEKTNSSSNPFRFHLQKHHHSFSENGLNAIKPSHIQ